MRHICVTIAATLALLCAPPLYAQSSSDDPFAPRTGVTYMSSDFMHGVTRIFVVDSAYGRLAKKRLPMGDARFGATPSLQLSQHFAIDAEGTVFARFLLDHSHLVSIDWIVLAVASADVALPRVMTNHLCEAAFACSLRVSGGARHMSAHGGDEFMSHEHLPFRIYSRDGYIGRAVLETRYAGARFEINDDVRTYGLLPETKTMGEFWLRPVVRPGARLGLVMRHIAGSAQPYRAVYAVLPFRIEKQSFDLRARLVRGAIPIGYVAGAVERAAQIELDIR